MSECIYYKDQGKEMGANRSKYARQKKWQHLYNVHKATRVQMAEDVLSNGNGKCA